MATRPVFVPQKNRERLVSEIPIDFKWNPGMSKTQKRKNIIALHEAAKSIGLDNLLEISTKSEDEIGCRLSAFSLKLPVEDRDILLECVYQGSKVFRHGGPYTDLFMVTPKEAKKDPRLKNSGELIGFQFEGEWFPLFPKNAFYDWLYIKALIPHRFWIREKVSYQGYTDIEFNPAKSVNCQARAFAELMALEDRGQLEKVGEDFSYFADLLPTETAPKETPSSRPIQRETRQYELSDDF